MNAIESFITVNIITVLTQKEVTNAIAARATMGTEEKMDKFVPPIYFQWLRSFLVSKI